MTQSMPAVTVGRSSGPGIRPHSLLWNKLAPTMDVWDKRRPTHT